MGKYDRTIVGRDANGNKVQVSVDVYDVISAWDVRNAGLQHLIKKALQPGNRGHKDLVTDLGDIVASAKRAIEIEEDYNVQNQKVS